MFYDAIRNDHGFAIDPFKALVARPIGWLSTLSAEGNPNLAPYSFFNIVSSVPTTLSWGPPAIRTAFGILRRPANSR